VLQLNPANEYARKKLAGLQAAASAPAPAQPVSSSPASETLADPYSAFPSPVQAFQPEPASPSFASPENPIPAPLPQQPYPAQAYIPPVTSPPKRKIGTLGIILLSVLGLLVCCLGLFGINYLLGNPIKDLLAGQGSADAKILAVIQENVDAMNAEDIQRYMATIHPGSPSYQTTEQSLPQIFEYFDLKATVTDLAIVSRTSTEIQVSFTLTTVKLQGPAFRDNRIKGIFFLRQDNGQWKIYNQTIQNVEYLN
jgi:hypothetical protein